MVATLHQQKLQINETVYKLASYYNRFFQSATGLASQQWLYQQYQIAAADFPNIQVTIKSFKHKWMMPSLIVRIETKKTKKRSQQKSVFQKKKKKCKKI